VSRSGRLGLAVALAACSSSPKKSQAPEPTAPIDAAAAPDAPIAIVDAGPSLHRTACDQLIDWRPPRDFLAADRVVHLRVAASTFGVAWGHDRCVALDLEVVDSFRGSGNDKPGDHLNLIVRQSTIEHYTSRPAGAWWIVEHTLAPGTEYVALCPPGPLATTLVGSCQVIVAGPVLADVRFARDNATAASPALLAEARTRCDALDYLAADVTWGLMEQAAERDPAVYGKVLDLLEDARCAQGFRAALLNVAVLPAGSRAHARRLAQAMFRLLAQPVAADLHDNLVVTWLPNALGLEGGGYKLTAAEVFAGSAARRAEARAAIAGYKGPADATPLRTWIR